MESNQISIAERVKQGESFHDVDGCDNSSCMACNGLQSNERDIDQVHCNECGRPMVIFVDDPRNVFICAKCKSGKAPGWEY